jgi:hypothetical protein
MTAAPWWRRAPRRMASLGPAEWFRLVQAMLVMPVVAGLAKLLGVRRLRRILCALPGSAAPPLPVHAHPLAKEVAAAVASAVRLSPWAPTCLHRSIALWWMLRRRGIDADIRYGVRSVRRALLAFHAWVECDGVVLNDRADVAEGYVLLDHVHLCS